jgi:hypothetical protein
VKPEQLEEFSEPLAQIIGSEVHDADTSNRILHRFELAIKQSEREILAEDDPFVPTNTKKRRRRAPAATPQPPAVTLAPQQANASDIALFQPQSGAS